MSEALDLYRRIADGFSARLKAVAAGAWDTPTPCPGWTAGYVPVHVVGVGRSYLAVAGGGPVPPALDAYVADMAARGESSAAAAGGGVAAFELLRAEAEAALEDPARVVAPVQTPFGELPLAAVISVVMGGDMLAHTWDLARAVGGDERLDPEACEAILGAWRPLDEALRAPGVCGPRIAVPDDADPSARFLGFVGRDVV